MTLKQWLRNHGLDQRAFAARVGCSHAGINYYVRGTRFPRPDAILAIEEETRGEVRAQDFFEDWRARHAPWSAVR